MHFGVGLHLLLPSTPRLRVAVGDGLIHRSPSPFCLPPADVVCCDARGPLGCFCFVVVLGTISCGSIGFARLSGIGLGDYPVVVPTGGRLGFEDFEFPHAIMSLVYGTLRAVAWPPCVPHDR